MSAAVKTEFLRGLQDRFGKPKKLGGSQSLYEVDPGGIRVYIRYSKIHQAAKTFYGLRKEDLTQLEGHPAVICFLWDGQERPLILPYSEYEEIFRSVSTARDGQYKVQVYLEEEGVELYIPKAGRFNVEPSLGWGGLERLAPSDRQRAVPALSHSQIQTLLGAIGTVKGFDIWIPAADRGSLDWDLAHRFPLRDSLPPGCESFSGILEEVDVIWTPRGTSQLRALFEVEHSTPIYSGLLRFNDVHLAAPHLTPRFTVVAEDERRSRFVTQVNRPTFRASGLCEACTFLTYVDVAFWYRQLSKGGEGAGP